MDPKQLAEMLYGAPNAVPMIPADPYSPPPVAEAEPEVQAPLAPVGQPENTFSAFGAPEPETPLTPAQGSVGVSAAHSGYSADKAALIERGPHGTSKAKKGEAGIRAGVEANYDPLKGELAAISQDEQAGTEALAMAGIGKVEAEASAAKRLERIQRDYMEEAKASAVDAQLAAQQAKAEYRARWESIPEVDPNQLWNQAGSVNQFGMAISAFVHDFLGAKGIKTSAMDTINGAIKRNIDAQIQNIQNKKETARAFKDLYEMTVAESATQMEVEAKLHGYLLKSVEYGIQAEMGRHNAGIAKAKGELALTAVRKEAANKLFDVEKQIDTAFDQAADRAESRRQANMTAAIARDRLQFDKDVATAKAKAEAGPKPLRYIFDPETGKGVRSFKPHITDGHAEKISERVAKFDAANKTMLELRELERTMKPVFDPFGGTRFMPQDQRQYEAITRKLAHEMLAATGERATDQDVKDYLKSLPTPTDFTRGGVSQILANTHAQMHESVQALLLQTADDVAPEVQPDGGTTPLSGGSAVDAEVGRRKPGAPPPEDAPLKRAQSPAAMEPGGEDDPDGEFQNFTKEYWKDYKKSNPGAGNKPLAGGGSRQIADMVKQAGSKDAPPKAFHELRELAEQAYGGNLGAKAKLQEAAKADLTGVAYDTPSGPVKGRNLDKKPLADMAQYFLDKLAEQDGKSSTSNPFGI